MQALLGGESGKDENDEVEVEEDDDEDGDDANMQPAGSGRKMRRLRMLHKALWFARQLQNPDWLIEMPQDLATNWLVQLRPEGDRCLLLSNDGMVMVRRKNGTVLESYKDSRFPQGLTVLDVVCMEPELAKEERAQAMMREEKEKAQQAVVAGAAEEAGQLQGDDAAGDAAMEVQGQQDATGSNKTAEEPEPDQTDDVDMRGDGRGRGRGGRGGRGGKGGRGGRAGEGQVARGGRKARPVGDWSYGVCDVLVWGDNELVSADAECRMFWLESRFAELPDKAERRARSLTIVPAKMATPEALSQAYHIDPGYTKDSLWFYHREGFYAVSEPVTPLALVWRDRQVSRWVVDTQDKTGQTLPERQAVVLEVRQHGWLRTADRVVVAQLDEEQQKEVGTLAQNGALSKGKPMVRFEVNQVDIASRKVSIEKTVKNVPARSRVYADTWGRIVFQHLHRKGKVDRISFQAVMKAAIGEGAVAVDEEK